jgi:hypothetical protein
LLTFAASALFAQTPDCSIAAGSKQDGKLREFDTETLYEYMDGNSEGYFLYGFSKMRGISCKVGPVTLIVDLSEFKSPELAYGMFTGNLDPRLPIEKTGAGGQVVDRKVIFVKGSWFAEIAAEPEGKHADLLRAAAKEWEKKLSGSVEPPPELKWFPKEKLQPGSPRLVPQSVLGMRILKRGYLAAYEQGKAVVITEESPAAAQAVFTKLKERFTANTAAQVGDEAFTAEDKYLGRVCFFRKGNRLAGWTNVPAGQDPAVLSKQLAATMQ